MPGSHRQKRRCGPQRHRQAKPPTAERSLGKTEGLDTTPFFGDAQNMPYPGGKNGAGVYQKIINLMPPH